MQDTTSQKYLKNQYIVRLYSCYDINFLLSIVCLQYTFCNLIVYNLQYNDNKRAL